MTYLSREEIKELALQEGFCESGAVQIKEVENDFLRQWLEKQFHASMSYMENYQEIRQNPALLIENAKTIISFLYSYNDERVDKDSVFKIAHYVQRKDYHYVLKQKLNNIIAELQKKYSDFSARAFVDSAPILERYWAEQCGLGWIGKSSLLINKDYGSKVFIGEIVCNYETDYNKEKVENLCGQCTLCLKSCPNNAITQDNGFDSKRCISYQTIENKENISEGFETKGYIYGCDICLEVCPWNKKAKKVEQQDMETKLLVQEVLKKAEQKTLEKKDFKRLAKLSPINRVKYEKFLSNIAAQS